MQCGGGVKKTPTKLPRKKAGGSTRLETMIPSGVTGPNMSPRVMKKGGTKKSFPDLNKDGKITKADVLKGRGVIKKKGGTVKKKK
jgi:hypothetical protein